MQKHNLSLNELLVILAGIARLHKLKRLHCLPLKDVVCMLRTLVQQNNIQMVQINLTSISVFLKWLSYSAIKIEQKPNGQKWATFTCGGKYNLLSVSAIPVSSFQTIKENPFHEFQHNHRIKTYLFHALNTNWKLYLFFAAVFLICE